MFSCLFVCLLHYEIAVGGCISRHKDRYITAVFVQFTHTISIFTKQVNQQILSTLPCRHSTFRPLFATSPSRLISFTNSSNSDHDDYRLDRYHKIQCKMPNNMLRSLVTIDDEARLAVLVLLPPTSHKFRPALGSLICFNAVFPVLPE